MKIQNDIYDFLINHGAGDVGFSKLSDDNVFGMPYAISFLIPLSDVIVDSIEDSPTHTYFHHYRTVNALIDSLSLRVGLELRKEGYKYVPVPASQSVGGTVGIFSHKYAATLSGLGSVGKSGLFISDKFGPRVRIGTILTDCSFECEKKERKSHCGECNLCVSACPAQAIRGKEWVPGEKREEIIDAKACSDYMKKKFQHIGRGAVCGICMRICPKGQSKK